MQIGGLVYDEYLKIQGQKKIEKQYKTAIFTSQPTHQIWHIYIMGGHVGIFNCRSQKENTQILLNFLKLQFALIYWLIEITAQIFTCFFFSFFFTKDCRKCYHDVTKHLILCLLLCLKRFKWFQNCHCDLHVPIHSKRLNISHSRGSPNYTSKTIICVLVQRHKSGLVYGVANSLRSKGMLFYRCLDKIVYAQLPSCSSIHNSSWHGIPAHSCNPTRC